MDSSTKKRAKKKDSTSTPQLRYPILVTSLPKSGTTSTQRFFQCGLGYMEAAHHWTTNVTSNVSIKIGKCMQYNLLQNRSILEECGDFKVWTDTGYMEDPKPKIIRQRRIRKQQQGRKTLAPWSLSSQGDHHRQQENASCYFPTMHGGLEHFYQSHPTGTLLHVVRQADQWYDSAMSWRKLPERLSKHCAGFPPMESSRETWMEFYHWHTHHVREFAQQHPSLVYLEVSLEAPETASILQAHTGIPDFCWGNCNPDPTNGMCGVLGKMQRHKLEQALAEMNQKPAKPQRVQKMEQSETRDRVAATTEKKVPAGDAQKKKKKTKTKVTGTGNVQKDAHWQEIHAAFDLLKNTPVEKTIR